jgi:hypothetical protein
VQVRVKEIIELLNWAFLSDGNYQNYKQFEDQIWNQA